MSAHIQDALFGDPAPVDDATATTRIATQDVELVASVVRLAQDPGYRLIERTGRVLRVVPGPAGAVEDAPRHEADTVLQLVDAGLVHLGGNHTVTYGGHSGPSRSVLVPRDTRNRVARWANLKALPRPRETADRARGTVAAPAPSGGHWCPECGEPAQVTPPTAWKKADGPRPRSSHLDGSPLCPVMGQNGYRPARVTRRRPT